MVRAIAQVIGVAQDAGVPQLGCACRNCRAARRDPRAVRRPSCLALRLGPPGGEQIFLLDAPAALPAQMDLLPGPAPVPDGILLTHLHVGHCVGLLQLGKESLDAAQVPVFCSPATGRFLSAHPPWTSLTRGGNIRVHPVKFDTEFSLGPLRVRAVQVPHRDEHADTCAYFLRGDRTLLYLPDIDGWGDFAPTFNALMKETDYAFIDGTFFSRDELMTERGRHIAEVPHPPVRRTLALLAAGHLRPARRATYFTHFNHTNPLLDAESDAACEVARAGFRVAREGLQITLGERRT